VHSNSHNNKWGPAGVSGGVYRLVGMGPQCLRVNFCFIFLLSCNLYVFTTNIIYIWTHITYFEW
jgi:hypothetical protein